MLLAQPTSRLPSITRRCNVVLMLGRRRKRRAGIKTTLGQCLVFAGIYIVELHQEAYYIWIFVDNKILYKGEKYKIH